MNYFSMQEAITARPYLHTYWDDLRTEFLRSKTLPHFCRVKTRLEQP
jgi:hypothetical protein